MISIGGQRLRTACASLIPSIEPGMFTSVNTILMSSLLSKIRIASSAFFAPISFKPSFRNQVHGVHQHERFIFDDQDHEASLLFHFGASAYLTSYGPSRNLASTL